MADMIAHLSDNTKPSLTIIKFCYHGVVSETSQDSVKSQGHKHSQNCKHGHGHGHSHSHTSTDSHAQHNDKPGEHAANCELAQQRTSHSRHAPPTPKDRKRRRSRRLIRQWGRRGNHCLQNLIAAVWIWSLSDSELRESYDANLYDRIVLFHALQLLSLMLFFYASLSEPGFLAKHDEANSNSNDADQEHVSLLQNAENGHGQVIEIDVSQDNAPPSFCSRCACTRAV